MAFTTIDLDTVRSLTEDGPEDNEGCKSDKMNHNQGLSDSESPVRNDQKEMLPGSQHDTVQLQDKGAGYSWHYDHNHQKWMQYRVIPHLVSDAEWEKAAVSTIQ